MASRTPQVGDLVLLPGCSERLRVRRVLPGGGLIVEWDPDKEDIVSPLVRAAGGYEEYSGLSPAAVEVTDG